MPDVFVAARVERPGIQASALGIASLSLLAGLMYLDTTVPIAASDSNLQTF
ncbi:hypothetical protein [Paraburkholderia sp. RL17-337-BIB-A]|uniref:hypothetical protein n=1 Tax=Paraburkholderia sp. RL17-337-BIB-A TaxID=3031636 RepID=UPI0038B8F575